MPHGHYLTTVGSINGLVAGDTPLYIVPPGFSAVITGIAVRVLSIVGSVVVPGTVSVGIAPEDMIGKVRLTGLVAVAKAFYAALSGVGTVGATGQIIKLTVDVPFAGPSLLTLAIDLFGYLF